MLIAWREENDQYGLSMPAGGVGPGLLDESLVVPDADTVDAGQLGRHFSEAIVEHEPADSVVVHPQVQPLGEDLVVVGISGAVVTVGDLAILASGDGLVDVAAPVG